MKKLFLFVTVIGLLFASCKKEEVNGNNQNENGNNQTETLCDASVKFITDSEFNEINEFQPTISSVNLNGDCLEITAGGSGCDPEPWIMNLNGKNEQSNSSQKDVIVELITNQDCLTVFTKTKSFDLSSLRKDGQNEITINLIGWEEPINYTY